MRKLPNPLLLATSVTLFLAFLPLALFNHHVAATVCKVGSIALLMVVASTTHPLLCSLTLGLGFSALGDLFLELNHIGRFGRDALFIFGLVAFLLAHLCYIALFASSPAPGGTSPLRRLGVIVITVTMVAMLVFLWPTLGSMRIPVIAYAFALAAMGITAQQSYFRAIVAVGSLLFVASDSMLAWAHFRASFAFAGPLIWFTYYAAQFLIANGVIRTDRTRLTY